MTPQQLERLARGEIRSLPKDGSFEEIDLTAHRGDPAAPIRAWRSRAFTVQLYGGEALRLSRWN